MTRLLASTWTLPIMIALATLAGLIIALTGDGIADTMSWVLLAVPVAAFLWAVRRQT